MKLQASNDPIMEYKKLTAIILTSIVIWIRAKQKINKGNIMKFTQTDNEMQTERGRVGSFIFGFAYLIICISEYLIFGTVLRCLCEEQHVQLVAKR